MGRKNKITSLKEAVSIIKDGDRLATGGFAVYQKPMAAIYEIIRSKKKDLTVVGAVNSIDVDILAGAGCLKKVETSYVGLESFGLALNFRRALQSGEISIDYYSEMMAWDRFRADWDGLPYWPAYYLAGSDIAALNDKIIKYKCPVTGKDAWAIPAAKPDVTILHVIAADKYGNALITDRHMYPQSMDITMSHAGGKLIITAEEIIDETEISKNANRVYIPGYKVDCVVCAPFGSHPTPTLSVTKTDKKFFEEYVEASKSKEQFEDFLEKCVFGVKSYLEYTDKFIKDRENLLE